MRRFVMVAILVIIGVMAWRVGGLLSTDAIGMAVGMVFGVLAGVPAALLVLATGRRSDSEREEEHTQMRADRQLPAYPYQSPVIVVTGGQAPQGPPQPAPPAGAPYYVPSTNNGWDGRRSERRFKMVGEREEWVE